MINCEYCGRIIPEGSSYCPNCGAPAPAVESSVAAAASDPVIQQGTGDYSLILVSLGTCTAAAASDLLEDVLGYTSEQAASLFQMVPAQAAQQLTYEQATYLAKAMTEYGMEVSVRNGAGYISLEESGTDSIFDSAGSFLAKAASVLGMITGVNRMRKFRKLDDRRYYERPFRGGVRPANPPKHIRRKPLQPEPRHSTSEPHHSASAQKNPMRPGMHHEQRSDMHGPGERPGSQPGHGGGHGPGGRPR